MRNQICDYVISDFKQRSMHSLRLSGLIIVSILLITLSSCEPEFEPFIGTHTELSAYGYLEANADTQWIRVVPGRQQLARPRSYHNHGHSLTIRGSRSIDFRDTLLNISDDEQALLFYTTELLEPLSEWEVSIYDSAMNEVTANVKIPDIVQPSDIHYDYPYYFENELRQTFLFSGVTKFFYVDQCYIISVTPRLPPFEACMRVTGGRSITKTDHGLISIFFQSDDRNLILTLNELNTANAYYLHAISLRVILASDDWLETGWRFHPESAIRPGILSNTSNNLGFIGGASVNEARWIPLIDDTLAVKRMGFRSLY